MTIADRIHGALLGTLLGDAFGRPFEGIARGDSRLRDAVGARAAHPHAWDYSDDGEMALAVAESVAAHDGVDEGHLLATLAARHEPARGYGKGSRAAFQAFAATGDWRAASRALWPEGSRGSGATVRVAGVAAWHVHDDDPGVVMAAAARSAAPTHAHPDAVDATKAMALALWWLMRGGSLRELRGWLMGADPAFRRLLHPRGPVADRPFAIDSLGWAVMVASLDAGFVDSVQEAVLLGHDTDTNAAMVGALAGASHGRAAIPAEWVAALPRAAVLRADDLSRKLSARSSSSRWVTDVRSVASSAGEDRSWVESEGEGGWLVVADGAGGAGRGAEAAQLVVERARSERPTSGRAIVRLLEAVDHELAARASGLTTAVVIRLDGSRAVGASVGDSVAWAHGASSCEELTEHQSRRPLIGSGKALPVPFVLSRVRRVLVATDGLSAFARPRRIEALLGAGSPLSAFVDAARLPSGGLRDDITVALAELSS